MIKITKVNIKYADGTITTTVLNDSGIGEFVRYVKQECTKRKEPVPEFFFDEWDNKILRGE